MAGEIIGLVGGAAALVFLFWPDAQPEPEPDPPPPLTLVDSDVDREENVAADVTVDGSPAGKFQEQGSLVSAVLLNTGNDPILVTQADVRISAVREIGCRAGGSASLIQALYDIKVPTNAAAGAVVTRKMKYDLPPHAQERIAFTVGPEETFDGDRPLVYTFTVVLRTSSGASVTVPPVTYLSRLTAADQFLAGARQAIALKAQGSQGLMDPACVPAQANAIARLVKNSPRPSPELRELSAELSEIAGP
ncbi:hypothetical protein [Streptomyces sp. SID1121]|uniref:hypothetical protein n=1 Tax=Streptomyces sp. SID1121 TaxID=3425888 RepID=UPI004057AC11